MLLYAGNMFLFQAFLNQHPLILTPDILPGVTTLVLMFLYYRIQDEFKDQETDRRFFPNRPVPSGRVRLQDLKILMWISIALMVAINIFWGAALGMFFVFLGFSVLMHFWFFMKKRYQATGFLRWSPTPPSVSLPICLSWQSTPTVTTCRF
jgi:4-hydroxybenzoate polyprenyltransferase